MEQKGTKADLRKPLKEKELYLDYTDLSRAVEFLQAGELVAFPTETVYGLGADATRVQAVSKIFQVKGRPATNPLIVHVNNARMARQYAVRWPDWAELLAKAFWPGPLTFILPKTSDIPEIVTAGRNTVGLRAPDHPIALELIHRFGKPLAAPSANRSNRVSPTTAEHVRDELGTSVAMILDGGPCRVGIESTVLDLTTDLPTLLRPGAITAAMIEEVIETPVYLSTGQTVREAESAVSPGQQAVHYAPRTPAYRFESHERDKIDPTDAAILPITLDADAYARQLYARLRLLDQQNLRAIYIELPPDTPEWHAVRDRILRATRPLESEVNNGSPRQ